MENEKLDDRFIEEVRKKAFFGLVFLSTGESCYSSAPYDWFAQSVYLLSDVGRSADR
jgi:hypothetical protein